MCQGTSAVSGITAASGLFLHSWWDAVKGKRGWGGCRAPNELQFRVSGSHKHTLASSKPVKRRMSKTPRTSSPQTLTSLWSLWFSHMFLFDGSCPHRKRIANNCGRVSNCTQSLSLIAGHVTSSVHIWCLKQVNYICVQWRHLCMQKN